MYRRLKEFFNKHDVFYQSRYGFRDNRSTEHAILDIVNTLASVALTFLSAEKGKKSRGVVSRGGLALITRTPSYAGYEYISGQYGQGDVLLWRFC